MYHKIFVKIGTFVAEFYSSNPDIFDAVAPIFFVASSLVQENGRVVKSWEKNLRNHPKKNWETASKPLRPLNHGFFDLGWVKVLYSANPREKMIIIHFALA